MENHFVAHLRKKCVNVVITNVCNLHCGGCTQHCGGCTQHCGLIPKKKLFFISKEQFLKAIDVAGKINKDVHLFGGEPSVHPDIEEFVDLCASQPDNRFFLWTNGRYTANRGEPHPTGYHGSTYSHSRVPNVLIQVDASKKGRDFAPTLVAPQDIMPLPERRDYFLQYAQKHCFMWKYCSMLFYDGMAYACECGGSFDRLGSANNGWPVEHGFMDNLTDEDIIKQMESFCYRCGLCLPKEVRDSKGQKADKPPVVSKTNYDIHRPYVL